MLVLGNWDEWFSPNYEKIWVLKFKEATKIKTKIQLLVSKSGIKIFKGHSPKNIKKATILVKSSAIKNNNVEIKVCKKK